MGEIARGSGMKFRSETATVHSQRTRSNVDHFVVPTTQKDEQRLKDSEFRGGPLYNCIWTLRIQHVINPIDSTLHQKSTTVRLNTPYLLLKHSLSCETRHNHSR
jgi:hypothetical protein